MRDEIQATVFIGLFAAMGTAHFTLFCLGRNYRFKRRCFPWVMGTLYLCLPLAFVITGHRDLLTILFAAGFALFSYLVHARQIRFCRSCGATNYNAMWPWRPMRFCQDCGSPLGGQDE